MNPDYLRTAIVAIIVALAIGIPLALDARAADQDVREYHLPIGTFQGTDGTIPAATVPITKPHQGNTTGIHSTIIVQAQYSTESSSIDRHQVTLALIVNGVNVCAWDIAIGTDVERTNPSINLECMTTYLEAGHHTFAVLQTAVITSNPITSSLTTITLRQLESIPMNFDVNTQYDFMSVFAPVVMWLVYLFISVRLPQKSFRVLALAVGLLILLVPMHGLVFAIITISHISVLAYVAGTGGGGTE